MTDPRADERRGHEPDASGPAATGDTPLLPEEEDVVESDDDATTEDGHRAGS